MKSKMGLKIVVDIAMTVALLLLMTYELIGEALHEWIGIGMFALFLLHHILNRHWGKNLLKGNYTMIRIMQTVLVVLILLSMLGSMFSGILLSRYIFSFLTVRGWRSFARNLHMISAYWGFVFMALHLGFHWNIMIGIARKLVTKPSVVRTWILRTIAGLIAGYGIYAFFVREIGHYMLMKNQFVFFDFNEPIIFFLIDYMAVMGLFVWIGYYLFYTLKCRAQKKNQYKNMKVKKLE